MRFVSAGDGVDGFTLHPDDRLAGRARLSLDDPAGYPWMCSPAGVQVSALFDELFAAPRTPPVLHPVSRSSPSVILNLLGDNRAVTLGPASVTDGYVRDGLVVRLPVVGLRLPLHGLGMVYPAEARREPGTGPPVWMRCGR